MHYQKRMVEEFKDFNVTMDEARKAVEEAYEERENFDK